MHWIIQNNLYQEEGHRDLLQHLERMQIPFTEVKVLPFSEHLSPHERMIPEVHPEGLVMVCGSTGLAKLATDLCWTPGSFLNDNHDYRVWLQFYGEHLLNPEAKVTRFADVARDWDEFFIRPCADTKTFSGQVFDWEEFADWRNRVINLSETYTTLDADTMVSYAPIKRIYREARFFVVDGEIATQSTYKIGSRVTYQTEVPPTMIEFARRMIAIWQPARAFVMDVALVDGDDYCKLIEINCINCSGFYAIDVQRFVGAIEAMNF